MAIYHLHCGFVSRSTGRSAVQSAAYISGEKLHEDRREQDICYRKKLNEVVTVKTLYPDNSKYRDISVWNTVENFEDNYAEQFFKSEKTKEDYKSSAQTASTIVLALPNELSIKTNEELLDKFINTRFIDRGLITTYAIHQKEGNLHAHLLISRRAIGEDGDFLPKKDREICTKFSLCETRKLWANLANEFLEREGFKERITEKSFEDLEINLEATKHRGWYADHIGTDSRLAQENLEIAKRNEEKILSDPNVVLDYLNEKKAVFTQKDILKFVSERVADDRKIPVIFEKVLNEAKYVGESITGEFLYTGEKYQKLESEVLTSFDNLSNQEAKTLCKTKIVTDVLEKYTYLSNEQKNAVQGLTQSDNFGILVGKAGAGKTTTMKAIAEIYKKSGARVIGMSLSAVASENLGKDAGIESATIASWEYKWGIHDRAKEKFLSFNSVVNDGLLKQLDWFNDLKRYEGSQLKAGDVIIVDEAGMVGAKEWHTILKNAEKFGAKVIAVGDDNQFKPISSGDCFKQFMKQNNTFELNEIRRQKEDWQKQASAAFAKLNTGTALGMYEEHGKIHLLDSPMRRAPGVTPGLVSPLREHPAGGNSSVQLLAAARRVGEKYCEAEQKGSAVVLCSTNKECREINNVVREIKKNKGELGEDIVKIGDMNFAKDDKIVFLENNKQFGVKNGLTGVVQAFEKGVLHVQTEEGEKQIRAGEYDKIDHAYAITLHKSQGKTYDRTIVLASKFMDAKAMYVAMTRHRDEVDLYYRKSDFVTFKALVNSASKYANKDSLEDYRNIENQNRARVIEYKELQIEKVQLLHDINKGVASWSEYGELKQRSLSLGKEMLRNFDSHKLYLRQQGITKETLEIQCGERQRPLSRIEMSARDTVELYAKTAQTARAMFENMKKESFNVTKNSRYDEYCKIRNLRNDLAKEILSDYPLHREFVNQMSREYFISKRGMEQQQQAVACKTRLPRGNSYCQAERDPSWYSCTLLQKLEKLSIPLEDESYRKYIVNSVDFVKAELESNSYRLSMEISKNDSGQATYVNCDMLKNYLLDKGLNMSAKKYMCEYASKLIQNKIDNGTIKEITPEEVVSSIKQSVCFEALREISKPDTPIEKLQSQAQVLSEHLTDKNIRALNDKTLMIQFTDLPVTQKNVQSLLQREDIQKELSKESRHVEISV